MQRRKLFLLPAAMVLLAYAVRLDPPRTLSELLERWEQASRACQSLDIRVTRFHYSPFSGCEHPESVHSGRFYYEAPDWGRVEIGPDEALVWSSDSFLQIDRLRQVRNVLPLKDLAQLRAARDQFASSNPTALTFWERFCNAIRFAVPLHPTEAVPLVLLEDRAKLERQFDVSLGRHPAGPLLTLKPRDAWWKIRCEQIDVILDPTTYRTLAVQMKSSAPGERMVYVLEEPHVNMHPADRDRLLELSATR